MQLKKIDNLYIQLKRDIVHGALPQGQALKQTQLAMRYGVSRIPIRDTLQRLKNEGWLVNHGKSGVMIRPLNANDAEDLYLMRLHIEPMLLAHAIPNINFETLGKAKDILQQLQTNEQRDILQQGELNWQFHRCLYLPAQRPALFETVAQLHRLCGRYIGFQEMKLDYLPHSQDEHKALLIAISTQDSQEANRVLNEHIRIAGEQLVNYLRHSV
ncbi:GntR family transcriptional regulator [Paraglaciecola sp. 20A4]|uniref:GntR family transcriptional regulator n=1 Tax=Paraglaciecola sp. 20A4 TaxID=2687288 RepID=UPI0014085382|nr:GntR family transcriptional regulator [Paraglaciecola sp. 20A4]